MNSFSISRTSSGVRHVPRILASAGCPNAPDVVFDSRDHLKDGSRVILLVSRGDELRNRLGERGIPVTDERLVRVEVLDDAPDAESRQKPMRDVRIGHAAVRFIRSPPWGRGRPAGARPSDHSWRGLPALEDREPFGHWIGRDRIGGDVGSDLLEADDGAPLAAQIHAAGIHSTWSRAALGRSAPQPRGRQTAITGRAIPRR
jgi:hypothetical protein